MKAIALLALVAVAAVGVYSQTAPVTGGGASGEPAQCNADCTAVIGNSCLYCPTCGDCQDVGVIDHCYKAGTAMLSFDDGPNTFTSQQLDLLKTLGIKASFWIIGQNINADLSYPAVVARIAAEGHLVGTHTQTHVSLNTITSAAVTAEMTQSISAIQGAIGNGYTVKHVRPPNGELNSPVREQVQAMGLTPIMWNTDTQDLLYGSTSDNMISNVTDVLTSYSTSAHSLIILIHALSQYSFDTITTIVSNVQKAGYTFVDPATCFDATTAGPTATSSQPVQCVHAPTSNGYQNCSLTYGCANAEAGTCCSHYQSCGTGEAFCGVGCLNGPCDVCVSGGFIPTRSNLATTVGGSGTTTSTSGSATGSTSTTTGSGATGASSPSTRTSGASTTSAQLLAVLAGAAIVTVVSMHFARKAF